MKQLVIIILVFLISSLSANSQNKIHREEFGLKGNVKSVKENSYKEVEKFGEIIKEKNRREFWLYDFYYIFNKEGNLINKYEYNSDGSLHSEYTFSYNKKGEVIENSGEETLSIISNQKPERYHFIYKYDNSGNIIEQSYFKSKKFLQKYSYKYNIENNIIEQDYYKSIDKLDSKNKYIYDDKGNIIERNLYESNGKLQYRYLSKFDDNGNEIEIQSYKPDGSLVYRGTFEYDNYGNIISGRGYTYKYEYDKNGNWISKIEFSDNIKGYIIEREIVYF